MKKLLVISLVAISLAGCGRVENFANNLKSTAGFLDRTVTLYDANGKVIKSWQTDNTIEYVGSVAGFIDKSGTNVRISGTFVVEGK